MNREPQEWRCEAMSDQIQPRGGRTRGNVLTAIDSSPVTKQLEALRERLRGNSAELAARAAVIDQVLRQEPAKLPVTQMRSTNEGDMAMDRNLEADEQVSAADIFPEIGFGSEPE